MRKRHYLILLTAALSLGLSACGGDVDNSAGNPKAAPGPALGASSPPAAASSPPAAASSPPAAASSPLSGTSATPVPVAADQPYTDPIQYSGSPGASIAANAVVEQAAVTHHTMQIGGSTVSYTATAGHLTASAPSSGSSPGAPEVSFFYVAYTLDGAKPGTRPVTFFWNGGPGSSTVWLHLGSFGPKSLDIDEGNLTQASLATQPTSFPLVDNDVTMLNDSDLVFVDATGTGYSEAIAPNVNSNFWGVDADAAAFRDFINRYITVNNRQTSPKYLYGESYGGIRTPIVANLLLQQGSPGQGGPALTGVIMNSPVLSYKSNCYMDWTLGNGTTTFDATNSSETETNPTVPCGGFIPSYAAIAYSTANPQASSAQLGTYVNQAISTTGINWATELVAVAQTSPPYFSMAEASVVAQMAALTGQTVSEWSTAFNMNVPDFASAALNLPAAQWDQVGFWTRMDRYNGLVTIPPGTNYVGPDSLPLGPNGQDASDYNDPAFANAIQTYLPGFLQYTSSSTYLIAPPAIESAWNWTHGTDTSNVPTSLPDLTEALTLDPSLKTIVFHGYHDLANPYYQSVLDIGSVGLAGQVPIYPFPGGQMTYLTKASRAPMKQSIDNFFNQAPASAN
jgi:carboxypeptidase C (cathepsin A)